MKYILLIISLIAPLLLKAQIDKIEYYIDNDPGFGLATDVFTTGGFNIDENFTVPTAVIATVGFHTLVVRSRDVSGTWSVQESRSFYVSASNLTTQANIVDVEYFIDTDPGYGAGTSLGAFAVTNLDINSVIPTNTLPAGFHVLYLRAQDSDGTWGDVESRSFYVSASNLTIQATITALEYYIDTDPGYGAGTAIVVGAATSIDINTTIMTNALLAGFHSIYIRALDSDGAWSEVESRSFYVDTFGNGQIAGIEYFIDTDPGYGAGFSIPVSPAVDSIDNLVTIPTSTLLTGNYELGMRILDTNGNFGMTDYYNFAICATATASFSADTVCVGTATTFTDASTSVIVGDVYSWDFDGDLVEDANVAGNQMFTFPLAGTYTATLSIDRLGCIDTTSVQVVVVDLPVPNAGIDQTLCGAQNTTLSGSTLATNEVGTWSLFSGIATITTPNNPATTITGIGSNLVDLIWTVSNTFGNCTFTDTVRLNTNLPINTTSKTELIDIGQTLNVDVQAGSIINTGDVLTTTILTDPTYGTATILANGTIDYVPDAGASIADTIVFELCNQCGNCTSNSAFITINNAPPSITQTVITPPIAGSTSATLDLTTIISDSNGNIDLTSLSVVSQPISGATANIDIAGLLTIDYSLITFSGTDSLSIEVCDFSGACTTQILTIIIDVAAMTDPPLMMYNVVTRNGDGIHDFFKIGNISYYVNNKVTIRDRWGGKVFEIDGYNNLENVFIGEANVGGARELDTGNYYYVIDRGDGSKNVIGFLFLKR